MPPKTIIYLYDERNNEKDSRVAVGAKIIFKGSHLECCDILKVVEKAFDCLNVDYSSETKEM